MADIHANTVWWEKSDDTRKLDGHALLECMQLFSVLKHEQGVGGL